MSSTFFLAEFLFQTLTVSHKNYANNFFKKINSHSVLFQELAKTLDASGRSSRLSCYSACPGWCYTNLARDLNLGFIQKVNKILHSDNTWFPSSSHSNTFFPSQLLFSPFAFMFLRSARRGAQNVLQVILEDRGKLVSGGMYK